MLNSVQAPPDAIIFDVAMPNCLEFARELRAQGIGINREKVSGVFRPIAETCKPLSIGSSTNTMKSRSHSASGPRRGATFPLSNGRSTC